MKIVILNAYGDDNETMSFYVDGELIQTTMIDGSNDCPETILDFMHEFGLSREEIGATEHTDLGGELTLDTNDGLSISYTTNK